MMEFNENHVQSNDISEDSDLNLYDPEILKEIDWTTDQYMKDGVTALNPGAGFVVRPLKRDDYNRGYVKLLGQLTKVTEVTKDQFQERFDEMKRNKRHYYITVIEDLSKGEIVAAATLFIELKFIRGCAMRARLEDVVVDDNYRGKQFGKLIVRTITLLAKVLDCYKIGLDCRDPLVKFYNSVGYSSEEGNDKSMVIRF